MQLSQLQPQGAWSVLLPVDGGLVEARNHFGDEADFKTIEEAMAFAEQFPESVICEFHSKTWEEFLSGKHVPCN